MLYNVEVTAQNVGVNPLQDSNTLSYQSVYETAYSHVHWTESNSGSLKFGQLVWPDSWDNFKEREDQNLDAIL